MPPFGKLDASGSPWIERLAGELGDRAALAVGREEAVVLLGGEAGERVEDVRVVRRALLDRPVLHRRGDDVGDARVERLGVLDRRHHRLEDRLRQPRLHHRLGEDVLAEDLAGCLRRREAGRRGLVRLDGGDRLLASTTSTHSYLLGIGTWLGAAREGHAPAGRCQIKCAMCQSRFGRVKRGVHSHKINAAMILR